MSVTFTWHGANVKAAMEAACAQGLFDGGQYLLGEAQKRVPINSGLLASTGESHVDRTKMQAVIKYGNEQECDYAAAVHESPESTNFQRGRERKWLEHTVNLYGKTALAIVAKATQSKFPK